MIPFLIMRPFLFLLATALSVWLPGAALHAQDASASATPTGTVTVGTAGFWRCSLPGGVYLVALRNIQSISTHEYVVDGAARVTELTVATASSVEARFYYLEPIQPNAASPVGGSGTAILQTMQQHVQDLATTHSPVEPVWEKVIKNYPATTHAHTVEYRLTNKANLAQLEQSLEQAWTYNKGASITSE